MSPSPPSPFRHPIRVVANRTDLSPATLRAWERRYEAVTPDRSEGGQRRYSDAQVDRLRLLKQVTDAGRGIGTVAGLDDEQLLRLAREDEAAAAEADVVPAAGSERDAAGLRSRAMAAVRTMSTQELDAVLRRGLLDVEATRFLEEVCAPLLEDIGDAWSNGEIGIAHEHAATPVIRRIVDGILRDASASADGPVIVLATLPGDRHELGLLIAGALAALSGWRVTYLGPETPPEEIAAVAGRLDAAAVGLGVTMNSSGRVERDLETLHRALPPGTGIVVGGRLGDRIVSRSTLPGLRPVDRLGELRVVLDGLPAGG